MTAPRSFGVALTFAVSATVLALACDNAERRVPLTPSPVASPSTAVTSGLPPSVGSGRTNVEFPPRDQPFNFRQQLETKYRDQLRRGPSTTYVDLEGDIVWIQEYIRYRVNQCGHLDAVDRVFRQIDTGAIAPVCGTPPAGAVPFPPRNEPFDFRQRLEAKYRDQLRRGPTQSFVDIEGDIVWIQEYLRYRVNNCDHAQATQRVFQQIDTGVVQPVCGVTPPPPPPPPTVNIQAVIDLPSGAINTNRDVQFSGLRSRSSVGAIVRYQWDCAVGVNLYPGCVSTSATPTFRYPKTAPLGTTATYRVRLTVTDSAGNSDSEDAMITVTQVY